MKDLENTITTIKRLANLLNESNLPVVNHISILTVTLSNAIAGNDIINCDKVNKKLSKFVVELMEEYCPEKEPMQ